MYLDTKNLLSVSASNDTQHRSKSYKKLRKGWKPLMKLITAKSTKKDNSIAHPNNVNLNNSNAVQAITQQSPDTDSYERKQKTEWQGEPYISIPVVQQTEAERQHKEIAIISSASINKSTDTNCMHCIYGRNCQHVQRQFLGNDINKKLLQNDSVNGLSLTLNTSQAQLIEDELINILLNYHI